MFTIELYKVSGGARRVEVVEQSTLRHFVDLMRSIDWPIETSRGFWARSDAPGMAVINGDKKLRFWFAGYNWAHAVLPGGGRTFRDSTEYVVGLIDETGEISYEDRIVPDLGTVESLFSMFFAHKIKTLGQAFERFPATDIYA